MKFFVFIAIVMQFGHNYASNMATNSVAGDSSASSVSGNEKPSRYSHNPYAYRVVDEDRDGDDDDDAELSTQNVNSLSQSNGDSTSTPGELAESDDNVHVLLRNNQDANTVNQHYDSEVHAYDQYQHQQHVQPPLRGRGYHQHYYPDYYNPYAYGPGYGYEYNGYAQTFHQQPYQYAGKYNVNNNRHPQPKYEHKKIDSKWTIFIRNYPNQWQKYAIREYPQMVMQELEQNNICSQSQVANVFLKPKPGPFAAASGFIDLTSSVNQEQARNICDAMIQFYRYSRDIQGTFFCQIQPNHHHT